MGEEKTCIRCGKPCAPTEMMCDDCKAWFQEKTANDAGQKQFKKVNLPKRQSTEIKKTNTDSEKKFCTKCGKELKPGAGFCSGCGEPVRAAEGWNNAKEAGQPDTNSPGSASGRTDYSNAPQDTTTKSNRTKIVAIAAVLVVALAATGIGAKAMLGKKDGSMADRQTTEAAGNVEDTEQAEEQAKLEAQEQERLAEEEEKRKAAQEQERLEKEQAEREAKELAIHNYEFVIKDCTWQQAVQECKDRGGYLVRINSAEEYQHIIGLMGQSYSKIHFYLGGRRDADGKEYYWVDVDNVFMEGCLNQGDSWTNGYWFRDEPSFKDVGSGAQNQTIDEAYMNLFCVSGTWYLNDSSDDLAGIYPDLLSGKVGYIIEYE